MATRLYCPFTSHSTGIAPTPDGWTVQSIMRRSYARTTKIADPMRTLSYTGPTSSSPEFILFRQYVTPPLTAGQTVTGGQALKAQFRISETLIGNNLVFIAGCRIIASDGATVRKTVLALSGDNTEASTSLVNRQFTATSAATNYTTVAGDRIVFEVGIGGTPAGGANHSCSMRLGDADATDLAEDNASGTDNNPWFQLNDTLTFEAETTPTPTRLYLPASAGSTLITPTPDTGWEDVSILERAKCSPVPSGDAMATVAFADSDDTSKDILFRQYVSLRLDPGQRITQQQSIKAQVRATEPQITNDMFVALGIRVMASDGTTVRKTVLPVTRTGQEIAQSTLENRSIDTPSASGNYTTVDGDRLVIELGTGGDPAGSDHDSSLRLGDAAASDLAEDNTSTSDDRPWIQFDDGLSFTPDDGAALEEELPTLEDGTPQAYLFSQSTPVIASQELPTLAEGTPTATLTGYLGATAPSETFPTMNVT